MWKLLHFNSIFGCHATVKGFQWPNKIDLHLNVTNTLFATMTSEEVSKYGIYFDEIYTLRVLEPDVASETNDLIDECAGYTQSTYIYLHRLYTPTLS